MRIFIGYLSKFIVCIIAFSGSILWMIMNGSLIMLFIDNLTVSRIKIISVIFIFWFSIFAISIRCCWRQMTSIVREGIAIILSVRRHRCESFRMFVYRLLWFFYHLRLTASSRWHRLFFGWTMQLLITNAFWMLRMFFWCNNRITTGMFLLLLVMICFTLFGHILNRFWHWFRWCINHFSFLPLQVFLFVSIYQIINTFVTHHGTIYLTGEKKKINLIEQTKWKNFNNSTIFSIMGYNLVEYNSWNKLKQKIWRKCVNWHARISCIKTIRLRAMHLIKLDRKM